jgi:hypothetical protein
MYEEELSVGELVGVGGSGGDGFKILCVVPSLYVQCGFGSIMRPCARVTIR